MQCAVIVTYKCNARCEMCYIWKHPSRTSEEVKPEHLESLPRNLRQVVISGGEPTLRQDIGEIAEVLYGKTKRLQLISNGTRPERLFELAGRFPGMSFRLSVDGLQDLHDEIRGLKNGFESCMAALVGLRDMGVKDLGISMTVSDRNCFDLLPLHRLAMDMGSEVAQSVPHNSPPFHKLDNEILDVETWEGHVEEFADRLLRSDRASWKQRAKDWVRAYVAHGYLAHQRSKARPLPCKAGVDFFTVDPFGNVLPCNGMESEMPLGNLKKQPFDDIWSSETAQRVRSVTKSCENCWMICNAVPSIRRHPIRVASWVARNKLRAHFTRRSSPGSSEVTAAARRDVHAVPSRGARWLQS